MFDSFTKKHLNIEVFNLKIFCFYCLCSIFVLLQTIQSTPIAWKQSINCWTTQQTDQAMIPGVCIGGLVATGRQSKWRHAETTTNQNGDNNVLTTSDSRNGDKPERRQTKRTTNQNGDSQNGDNNFLTTSHSQNDDITVACLSEFEILS